MIAIPFYNIVIIAGVNIFFQKDYFNDLAGREPATGEELYFLMLKEDKKREDMTADDFYPIGICATIDTINKDGDVGIKASHRFNVKNLQVDKDNITFDTEERPEILDLTDDEREKYLNEMKSAFLKYTADNQWGVMARAYIMQWKSVGEIVSTLSAQLTITNEEKYQIMACDRESERIVLMQKAIYEFLEVTAVSSEAESAQAETNEKIYREDAIRKQVLVATEEADLVLFLVDVNTGLTDWDEDVALILRRAKLPVILVANKVDNSAEYYEAAEFYKLGLGDPQCISAATGGGTGDLLDMILDKLQDNPEEAIVEDIPRFAVVGRPNAGKSSIINAFIGEDRNIVTEIAGTTRDSIYTRYDKFGFDFYLVDTAGIRRKNKVSEDLEFYSVMRSIRAIENSDVCILMLDATRGIETQDMNIFQLIQKNNKSLVVVVNKWDLVENKDQKVITTFETAIRNRMAPFVDFPIIFASALTKQRIFKVLETAKQVYQNRKAHIGTSKLNEVMLPIIEAYPPQSVKGKYIKIKYCTQLPNTTIPSFVFYANLPQYVKENYRRFLENKIRENWSLHGCPINIFIRQK